ncbi:hypothetical protein Tco_0475652 [Tanacetum coccineum]
MIKQVDDSFCEEPDVLKRSVDSSDYQMTEDEEAAKSGSILFSKIRWTHELNKPLEQKYEMKLFVGFDTMTLKPRSGKKIMELEDEKRAAQKERDRLQAEI